MAIWRGISPGPERFQVLVRDRQKETLHPRALATLCEALAFWCGQPVHAALAAGGPDTSFDMTPWLGQDGPTANAFFERAVVSAARPPREHDRLEGLGDFRDLRQLIFVEVAS